MAYSSRTALGSIHDLAEAIRRTFASVVMVRL
jgi:hypothetical protein